MDIQTDDATKNIADKSSNAKKAIINDSSKLSKTAVSTQDAKKSERDAEDSGVARLTEAPKKIASEVINLISEEASQKYKLIAFERKGNVLKVAMVDPQNIEALNLLRFVAEKEKVGIEAYQASEEIFLEMYALYSGPSEIIQKAVKNIKDDVIFEDDEEKNKYKEKQKEREAEVLKDAPVAKLVQVIISHAIEGKSSDIHIEPMDKEYRVRYRVDGILHLSLVLPKAIGPAVISRIKILSNLKIDEKRKPQDGRFRINGDGRDIDFRVSILPVIDGEKVVMRILDKDEGVASIEALGLLGKASEDLLLSIQETYGMILFTGPTGSGKSTSLYALLKILNNEERNIITLEDPIEYNIEGLNQSQIKPEIGYTFASGLRSILRQDPNVIMVGEIRDAETAELAVHAALTGHLMFSTLHTNTALGAIPRLIDMGIEPFLLSSSLRIVVSQRLVRRICEECKEQIEVPDSVKNKILEEIKNISENELKKYGIDLKNGMHFYLGKGCEKCGGTGLKGRLAIYEAVRINDKIKDIMTEKKGSEDLLIKEREAMGVLTIKQDGILKAMKGFTTLQEIERVTEGSITLTEEND